MHSSAETVVILGGFTHALTNSCQSMPCVFRFGFRTDGPNAESRKTSYIKVRCIQTRFTNHMLYQLGIAIMLAVVFIIKTVLFFVDKSLDI